MAILSITESNILMVLGDFLTSILPGGVEIVRGLDNRVPEPEGNDFLTMTPILRERLETNIDSYVDTETIGFAAFVTTPTPGDYLNNTNSLAVGEILSVNVTPPALVLLPIRGAYFAVGDAVYDSTQAIPANIEYLPLNLVGYVPDSFNWCTPDGMIAIGSIYASPNAGDNAAYWESGTWTALPFIGGYQTSAGALGCANPASNIYVVGIGYDSLGNNRAILWLNGTPQDLGTMGETGLYATAFSIANDASAIVGLSASADNTETVACIWKPNPTWGTPSIASIPFLATCTYGQARAGSISGAVVGNMQDSGGNYHAFYWTSGGGTVDLGLLPNSSGSYATGISDDGNIVVGYSSMNDGSYHSWKWTNAEGLVDFGIPTGIMWMLIPAIANNGNYVSILGYDASFNQYAFRWDAINGLMEFSNSPTLQAAPTAVTSSGVMYGQAYNSSDGNDDAAFFTMPSAAIVGVVTSVGYGQKALMQPTKVTVQLDVHGPSSADNSQIISTAFRDELACDFFSASGYNISPLYADDPKQIPFLNAEQQIEERWVVDLVMQANPIISTSAQFMDAAGPVVLYPQE